MEGVSVKFCMYCGVTLPRKAVFCFDCGEKQLMVSEIGDSASGLNQPQSGSPAQSPIDRVDEPELQRLAQKFAGILCEINPEFEAYYDEVIPFEGEEKIFEMIAVGQVRFFANSGDAISYLGSEFSECTGSDDLEIFDGGTKYDENVFDYGSTNYFVFYGMDAAELKNIEYLSSLRDSLRESDYTEPLARDARDFILWAADYVEALLGCDHKFNSSGLCGKCKTSIDDRGLSYWASDFSGSCSRRFTDD